jgi:hypothetical protein
VQSKLVRYCAAEGIAVTAFSPLGSSSYVEIGMAAATDAVIDEPVVKAIATKHARTPAQCVLRWGLQLGASSSMRAALGVRQAESVGCWWWWKSGSGGSGGGGMRGWGACLVVGSDSFRGALARSAAWRMMMHVSE